jgi:hypothetical protein
MIHLEPKFTNFRQKNLFKNRLTGLLQEYLGRYENYKDDEIFSTNYGFRIRRKHPFKPPSGLIKADIFNRRA